MLKENQASNLIWKHMFQPIRNISIQTTQMYTVKFNYTGSTNIKKDVFLQLAKVFAQTIKLYLKIKKHK